MKKSTLFTSVFCFVFSVMLIARDRPLKVFHICLHKGCANDFAEVARELSLDLTTWYIQDLPREQFDALSPGNTIYNIDHGRAKRVWDKNKVFFNTFDVVVTSDIAPLSRIFLQNGWRKPLIIWVCNRFDYADSIRLDREYYDLIRKATQQKNVRIVSYTPYEHHYARSKGIEFGTFTIKPVGCVDREVKSDFRSAIPAEIEKTRTLFVYPRLDPHQVRYVQQQCAGAGIPTYCGVYNGPDDLKGFKGIIYFPYAWSNLALFENLHRGLIHFVPSEKFVRENARKPIRHFTLNNFHLCEWYCPEYRHLLVYFDSWQDLKQKIEQVDYTDMSKKIKSFAIEHRKMMLEHWGHVFEELRRLDA